MNNRPKPMARPAYVFDAHGTLFDVHSAVARHRDAIGLQAERLSEIWRMNSFECTWVRSLCGAYCDFASVTAQALDFAAERCGGISYALRSDLIAAYQRLDAYPEVRSALVGLLGKGARLAILSNGTQRVLQAAVAGAGLEDLFEAVLSVDEARIFKTAPQAYELINRHMRVTPDAVSFQSSNRWDVAGAVQFGFRAVWINRSGAPDEYLDLTPNTTLSSLEGLVDLYSPVGAGKSFALDLIIWPKGSDEIAVGPGFMRLKIFHRCRATRPPPTGVARYREAPLNTAETGLQGECWTDGNM